MTREERLDWLCRLRCWVVAPPLMTVEQKSKCIEALTEVIDDLQTEPYEDVISRQAVHDMLENLPITVEDKWFNWLQKACIRLAKLPSVQPEPFINKPCVSEQACHEDKMKILEKIKTEIEAKCCITVGRECDGAITLHDVFEIIDKYKAESEGYYGS